MISDAKASILDLVAFLSKFREKGGDLRPLKIGGKVILQGISSRLCNQYGKVISIRETGRSSN